MTVLAQHPRPTCALNWSKLTLWPKGTVNVLEQYVLSNRYGVVHFFVPPRIAHQLCTPLAARCRLAEKVYQFNSDAKSIVSVILDTGKIFFSKTFQYFITLLTRVCCKQKKLFLCPAKSSVNSNLTAAFASRHIIHTTSCNNPD